MCVCVCAACPTRLTSIGFVASTSATTTEVYKYYNGSVAPPSTGDPTLFPLNSLAVICHQGYLERDAVWSCYPYPISHQVCGHPGLFSWDSPTYSIWEDHIDLRLTVVRTGGGLGRATVKYNLAHVTTTSDDVTPTIHYTSTQVCASVCIFSICDSVSAVACGSPLPLLWVQFPVVVVVAKPLVLTLHVACCSFSPFAPPSRADTRV